MKTNALPSLIGKTITGVVVKLAKKENRPPTSQLHLVFSDGTSLEIYSVFGEICLAGGLDRGGIEAAKKYLSDAMDLFYEVYIDDEGQVSEHRYSYPWDKKR
jgi:hypothetical protein